MKTDKKTGAITGAEREQKKTASPRNKRSSPRPFDITAPLAEEMDERNDYVDLYIRDANALEEVRRDAFEIRRGVVEGKKKTKAAKDLTKSENYNPHKDHRQRTMESFIANTNPASIPSHILLEMLLYHSIPRIDTNETAHRLIDHFGSFNAVFEAPVYELESVEGIGKKSAALIRLNAEIRRRYDIEAAKPAKSFAGTDEIGNYFFALMRGYDEEQACLMLLDDRLGLLNVHQIGTGKVDTVDINIRKIIQIAVCGPCKYIVIAHNHPSGDCEPSDSDLSTTLSIKHACDRVGIRFLEHFIIGKTSFFPIIRYIEKKRQGRFL